VSGEQFKPSDEARATQCLTVLAALRAGPQRTADLYRLGVLAGARRILELRRAGHCIDTIKIGRIGVYVLREEVPT
jgi:hypothetical protein